MSLHAHKFSLVEGREVFRAEVDGVDLSSVGESSVADLSSGDESDKNAEDGCCIKAPRRAWRSGWFKCGTVGNRHKLKEFAFADECVAKIIEKREVFDKKWRRIRASQDAHQMKRLFKHVKEYVFEVERTMKGFCDQMAPWFPEMDDGERDDKLFHSMIEAAGSRTGQFLDCFHIDLNAEEFPGTLAARRFQYPDTPQQIGLGPLEIAEKDSIVEAVEFFNLKPDCKKPLRDLNLPELCPDAYDFWETLAKTTPDKRCFQIPTDPVKMREFEFRWIFFEPLVDALGPYQGLKGKVREIEKHLNHMHELLSSLLAVDNHQHIFEKTPVQALTKRTSQLCLCQFYIQACTAFVALFALMLLTIAFNIDPKMLTCDHDHNSAAVDTFTERLRVSHTCGYISYCYWMMWPCCILEMFVLIFDMIVWGRDWLTLWNTIDFCLELTSVALLFVFLVIGADAEEVPPILFPIVIATRWMKFVLIILYNDYIGQSTLPALLAALSKSSVALYMTILMASAASAHSYLGFRVRENGHTLGQYGMWGVFKSYVRMTHLIMFADADVNHLAGRREYLSEEDGKAYIDDEEGEMFKPGDLFTTIEAIHFLSFVGLGIGVVLMNTYVGVLFDKYVEFNAHAYHYFHQYRSLFQVKALVRRKLWVKLLRQILSLCVEDHHPLMERFASLNRPPRYKGELSEKRGYTQGLWIVGPAQEKGEIEELDVKMDSLMDDVEDIKKQMADVHKKLCPEQAIARSPTSSARPDDYVRETTYARETTAVSWPRMASSPGHSNRLLRSPSPYL